MSIIETIGSIMIPAIKEEFKKIILATIDKTLYHEPYDFSEVVPGASTNQGTIRVIGKIVTRY